MERNDRQGKTIASLQNLADALTQAREWPEAERVARPIEDKESRASALRELASALAQAGGREQAQPFWREAERVARSLEGKWGRRADGLHGLASAMAQAGEWPEAERVAHSIDDKEKRALALRNLATA